MEISTEYVMSDSFKEWLKEMSPGVYSAVLRCDAQDKPLKLTVGLDKYLYARRFKLTFPFYLNELESHERTAFDRQVDTDICCIVLTYHPDVLSVTKPHKPSRPLKTGDVLPMHLEKLPHHRGIIIPVTVKSVEAYMAELEVPGGHTFRVDVDELSIWGC